MQFTPKDEATLERERADRQSSRHPWPKGVYDFEVASAKDNEEKGYIELDVVIFADDGEERHVKDWLTPKAMYKLRHFCEAAGLIAEYDAGELVANLCSGITGKCEVKIEKGRKKEGGGFFDDQNRIADYLKREDAVKPGARAGSTERVPEDDIPF